MGNLAASCVGYYTGDIVYDIETFNSLTGSDLTLDMMLNSIRRPGVFSGVSTINGAHFVYKYEVDGKTFYRAEEHGVHSKNARSVARAKRGIEYKVNFDPFNPADAVISDRITPISKAEKRAVVSFVTGIISMVTSVLVIPSVILGIISIVFGVRSIRARELNSRWALALCGVIFGMVGLSMSPFFAFFEAVYLFELW